MKSVPVHIWTTDLAENVYIFPITKIIYLEEDDKDSNEASVNMLWFPGTSFKNIVTSLFPLHWNAMFPLLPVQMSVLYFWAFKMFPHGFRVGEGVLHKCNTQGCHKRQHMNMSEYHACLHARRNVTWFYFLSEQSFWNSLYVCERINLYAFE